MAWQAVATAVIAVLSATLADLDGFLSAVLGGSIGVAGVLAFALVSSGDCAAPSDAVRLAVRAEAVKIAVIVLLLWLFFTVYAGMVVLAFIGAFTVSVLLSGVAFAVSDG
jgi:ATP synthase protein I